MSLTAADDGDNAARPVQASSLRWTVPLFVLLGLLCAWRLLTIDSPSSGNSPAVGRPAPQIDLVILNDQPTLERVQACPLGSVSLLHFWGTWCGPCRMEFPDLVEMVERFEPAPEFRFLPVSCESHGGETFGGILAKTTRYYKSEGIATASYVDPRGVTRRSLAQRLGSNSMAYPTTVVIDTDGRIAGVWEGYTPETVEQVESLLIDLMAKARDPQAAL